MVKNSLELRIDKFTANPDAKPAKVVMTTFDYDRVLPTDEFGARLMAFGGIVSIGVSKVFGHMTSTLPDNTRLENATQAGEMMLGGITFDLPVEKFPYDHPAFSEITGAPAGENEADDRFFESLAPEKVTTHEDGSRSAKYLWVDFLGQLFVLGSGEGATYEATITED